MNQTANQTANQKNDMCNYILINNDDLLDNAHSPALIVLAEFGTYWGGRINIRTIFSSLCNDKGYGGECGECLFIGSGVYFEEEVNDESCVLSFREMYHYMKIMADRYCQQRPQHTSYFNDLLEKFKRNHNV